MNKFKKVVSVFIAVTILLISITGCSSEGKYAMEIGDIKIPKEQYKTTAISIKDRFLSESGEQERDELWDEYIDSSYTSTVQEYLDSMVQSHLISSALYSIHFDELGLTLDEETEKEIQGIMDSLVSQAGGKEKLEEHLKEQGFTYETYKDQYYNEAKKTAIILYYFGKDSTENPISREELILYYREYYTKVKHIFFSTKDKDSNDLSNPKKAEIGQKAQQVYDRIMNGEDYDALMEEYGEDPGMAANPNGYIFSTDDTSYTQLFHDTAFDMEAGEVRLIQTNLGYHIMKKYDFTEEDITDKETEAELLETMMSEESAQILNDLKERIGVTYHNDVLEKLSVRNIKIPSTTNDVQADIDSLKDQLGLTEDEE